MTAWLLIAASLAVQTAPVPAAPSPATEERLAEILVHGNHTTRAADVAAAAGLVVGTPLPPGAIEAAKKRLEKTGRFEGVDIRKRYRSIDRLDDVVLVILIDEKPHPLDLPSPPVLRPMTKLKDGLMFLPELSYEDGYGLSYGARVTFADVLGKRGRLSIPLTWGADRRFRTGPFSRLAAGAALSRREHPRFDVPDRRGQLWARAERALPGHLRVGGGWRWSDVSFGSPATPALDLDERMTTAGVDLALDTRVDPTFPRNAIYARAAWEHLDFDARPSRQRVTLDGRGYVGLVGSAVLGVRAFHGRADGPLPVYEQWLLGGQSTVRGFKTGSAIGDRLTTGSLELRLPFSSPLKVAKTGVSVFWDTGTTWDAGARLADQPWKHGYGAGVFAIATIFQMKLEVAHGSDGDTRLHASAGFTF
jgi:hypothetical protein